MKIAHVVGTFYPRFGGMGAVVADEARALTELGHSVTVFTICYPGMAKEENHDGYKVRRFRPWLRLGDAGSMPQLFFALKGFDVVHLHFPFYGGADWVALHSLFFGTPYVLTYHMDARPTSFLNRIFQVVYDRVFSSFILHSARQVVAVDIDYAVSGRFSKYFRLKVPEYLPNPVDTKVFYRREPAVNIFPPAVRGKKVLLFVGNLLPVKRLDLLFFALEKLSNDIVVCVVGGGYAELKYKKLATELGLDDRVYFLGTITDRGRLAGLYSSATATVIPSDHDSFSLVALEAVACGCAVVASDIPGLRGRVQNSKFLFPAGSVMGLVEAINNAVDAGSTRASTSNGVFEERYGLRSHAHRLQNIYQHVI